MTTEYPHREDGRPVFGLSAIAVSVSLASLPHRGGPGSLWVTRFESVPTVTNLSPTLYAGATNTAARVLCTALVGGVLRTMSPSLTHSLGFLSLPPPQVLLWNRVGPRQVYAHHQKIATPSGGGYTTIVYPPSPAANDSDNIECGQAGQYADGLSEPRCWHACSRPLSPLQRNY